MTSNVTDTFEAFKKGDSWVVQTKNGKTIATVSNESFAKLMAASPYMLEALKAVSNLLGDEDLPDNGELSGAAISDMVRSAVELATK